MNNEPCLKCGEYHSCTELILQQQAEIDALKKESDRYKMAWNMAENEIDRLLGDK